MAKEGRPTKFSDEIIKETEKYLASCEDIEDEFHKTRGEKSDSFDRIIKVNIPTIEGLAVFLKVHRTTIYEWELEHKEFSYILEELRAKQANALISKGLSGQYNSTIAKVLLTKHGYREGVENTGLNGTPLIPNTEVTDEQFERIIRTRAEKLNS